MICNTGRCVVNWYWHSSCKSTVVCCLLDMVVGLGMLGMPTSHAQSSCVYLFVSVVFTLITSLNKWPCYIITDGNAYICVDSDKRRMQCWICPRLPFLSLFVVFHKKCTYLSGETSVKIKCNRGVIFMLFFDLRHI